MENAAQVETAQGKLNGGVGLELHALTQAIDVHARHHGLLCLVGRFLLHDGGEGDYLIRRQSCLAGFKEPRIGPKAAEVFLHFIEQAFWLYSPENFIRVGDKEARQRVGVYFEFFQLDRISEKSHPRGRVSLQVGTELCRQGFHGAQRGGNDEPHGRLLTGAEAAEDAVDARAGVYVVAAGVHMRAIAAYGHETAQPEHGERFTDFIHLIKHGVGRVVGIDKERNGLPRAVGGDKSQRHAAHQKCEAERGEDKELLFLIRVHFSYGKGRGWPLLHGKSTFFCTKIAFV